jgi:hypothetical protein
MAVLIPVVKEYRVIIYELQQGREQTVEISRHDL